MKKIALILFAIFINVAAYSVFLKNVPVDLKQPDGTIIHCFITGDEFHRRVHDKDNYTIVQNPHTGYYVYASVNNEVLVPSENVVGECDPSILGIKPNLDIPYQKMEEIRTEKLKSAKIINENSTKGDFNNIVISIRFSDQQPTTLTLQDYEDRFNSSTGVSLKSYYKEVSNSQLNVSSYFFPITQNQTISEYQDTHPRSYYLPYDEITNPIGDPNISGFITPREQVLFGNAIKSVADQVLSSKVNFDLNNDGNIDNIIFVIQGQADSWGRTLWPSSNSGVGIGIIGNKPAIQYNKQLSKMLDVGTICHEFFHAIGAPDLYHYNMDDLNAVGAWDIMGNSTTQHMTSFMKWKYGKWFDQIPEIKETATYTLKPISKSPFACYKIPSPANPLEYFIVEYRKKEGMFESSLPTNFEDGLIIYRINTKVQAGNASGPPDEIYIYRPDGTMKTNGDISKAAFSTKAERPAFNSFTNPSCFLSDGTKGWIDISNITATSDYLSFTVNTTALLNGPRNVNAKASSNQVSINWNSPIKNGNTLLGFNIYRLGSATPLNTSIVTDSTFQTSIPGNKDAYTFNIVAKYQQGESDPVIFNFVNHETPSIRDSLILVSLYKQCNGPNWTRHSNWLSAPLNTWEGVKTENGRVTSLEQGSNMGLPSANLSGNLPSELSDLSELTYLDLSNNKISGIIPESLSRLVKLKELDFWGNQFSGTLPSSWSSLTNLEILLLGNNKISGTLPESWSSLVNLKTLYLKFNQITGNLPSSWYKLAKVERIGLESNLLNGNLPESWSALSYLNVLSLSDNKFEGSLPSSWSNMNNLEYLFLGNNRLSGTLPDNWSIFKNLKYLLLYENELTGSLPASWSSLNQLIHLQIYSNHFTGTLPASWSSMSKLTQFSVWGNQLTGIVPNSWNNLLNLEGLIINDNQLSGLPDLSSLVKLQTLDARNNFFDFGDIEPNIGIPKNVFNYAPQARIGKEETVIKKSGENLKLSVTLRGKYNKYQWYKNWNIIPDANQAEYVIPSLKLSDAGIYTCQISNTLATQLILDSQPITLQVNEATFNSELSSAIFRIYPNPTTGMLRIEGLTSNQKNEISIQSIDGKLIRKIMSYLPIETIDISEQAPGTYLLIINNQSCKIQKK